MEVRFPVTKTGNRVTSRPDNRAIIVGAAGQDGSLLFELLANRGYGIAGVERAGVRVKGLAPMERVDLANAGAVDGLVRSVSPDEIYYLAAFHHSSEDKPVAPGELFARSHEVHVAGLIHFIEAIRRHAPDALLFYASSSHVFGEPETPVQNEETPVRPNSIYAITKASGMEICRFYRSTFGIHASAGILYNHESPRRRPQFLSKKIVTTAVKIRRGQLDRLTLGSLSDRADWGYAPEYVEAMTRILSLPAGDDFVISTGMSHTVQDFVEAVFSALDLEWSRYAVEDPSLLSRRPPNSMPLVGNPQKLERASGWRAQTNLEQMARHLVAAEMDATR
jgi:GDPmannose 4,6-dehydratase